MRKDKIISSSVVIQLIAMIVVFSASGAGHGTYAPARILFPYSMLSVGFGNYIYFPYTIIGFIQFPLYGFILVGMSRTKYLKITIIALAIAHIITASICFIFPNEFFPN